MQKGDYQFKTEQWHKNKRLRFIWFVANYTTLYLKSVVRIEKLNLVKLWQVRQQTKYTLSAGLKCSPVSSDSGYLPEPFETLSEKQLRVESWRIAGAEA